MKYFNPHSDILLTYSASDKSGAALNLGDLDFSLALFAGSGAPFVASHDKAKGSWVNCRPSATAENSLDILIPRYSFKRGQVFAELHLSLEDNTWPGGVRHVCDRQPLDVFISDNARPNIKPADVRAILPFAAISAYQTAAAAGFSGTEEEFYASLAALGRCEAPGAAAPAESIDHDLIDDLIENLQGDRDAADA